MRSPGGSYIDLLHMGITKERELKNITAYSAFPIDNIPVAPAGLTHLQIQELNKKLFFIKFTPVIKLWPHWYLIQVVLDSNLAMQPITPKNCMY